MQLLFDVSYENGEYECLGLIPGTVKPFELKGTGLKVPHMGWNDIAVKRCPIMGKGIDGGYVYFVHSYHAAGVPEDNVAATCVYGYEFVCGVMKDNIYGLQFHPEKSGDIGLEIIKNWRNVMKLYPAIDIKDGKCVRLVQGELTKSKNTGSRLKWRCAGRRKALTTFTS
jgi:imidazole glycerol phosphate synthase glutamine amidotransferase subunit